MLLPQLHLDACLSELEDWFDPQLLQAFVETPWALEYTEENETT